MGETNFNFNAPPIWEVGLSATTQPGVYDPFDVAAVHKLFERDMPRVEHQFPFEGLQPLAMQGATTINFGQVQDQRSRWWFLSPDGIDLMQFQEDFIARNWRRSVFPPVQIRPYPGFDFLFASYKEQIQRLTGWHAVVGTQMPPPVRCELLYDNLIPIEGPDGKWKLAELIGPAQFPVTSGPRANFNMSWVDKPDADGPGSGIQVVIAGVMTPPIASEPPRQFLKMSLAARADKATWLEAFDFYESAHDDIRQMITDLTTERLRATWR